MTRRHLLTALGTMLIVPTLRAQSAKKPAPKTATVTLIVDGMT